MKVCASAVVVMVVRKEHVVHLASVRIDTHDVSRNPFAAVSRLVWQDWHHVLSAFASRMVAAIYEDGRSIREDEELRFRNASVDHVNLEVPRLPRGMNLADCWIPVFAANARAAARKRHTSGGKRAYCKLPTRRFHFCRSPFLWPMYVRGLSPIHRNRSRPAGTSCHGLNARRSDRS